MRSLDQDLARVLIEPELVGRQVLTPLGGLRAGGRARGARDQEDRHPVLSPVLLGDPQCREQGLLLPRRVDDHRPRPGFQGVEPVLDTLTQAVKGRHLASGVLIPTKSRPVRGHPHVSGLPVGGQPLVLARGPLTWAPPSQAVRPSTLTRRVVLWPGGQALDPLPLLLSVVPHVLGGQEHEVERERPVATGRLAHLGQIL